MSKPTDRIFEGEGLGRAAGAALEKVVDRADAFSLRRLPRPVLASLVLLCVGAISSLGSTVLNFQKTNLDSVRAEVTKNRADIEDLKRGADIAALRWTQWTRQVQRTEDKVDELVRKINEQMEEQLRSYRAAAWRRGDSDEASRLTSKIERLRKETAAGSP